MTIFIAEYWLTYMPGDVLEKVHIEKDPNYSKVQKQMIEASGKMDFF